MRPRPTPSLDCRLRHRAARRVRDVHFEELAAGCRWRLEPNGVHRPRKRVARPRPRSAAYFGFKESVARGTADVLVERTEAIDSGKRVLPEHAAHDVHAIGRQLVAGGVRGAIRSQYRRSELPLRPAVAEAPSFWVVKAA